MFENAEDERLENFQVLFGEDNYSCTRTALSYLIITSVHILLHPVLWHLVWSSCFVSHLLLIIITSFTSVTIRIPTIVFLLRITLFQFRPKRGDDSDSECIPRDRLLQHRTLACVASGALDLGFRTEKIAEENPGTIWDAWLRSETWNIWNTVKWFKKNCQAILGMEMKVLLHDNDCFAES